MFKTDSFLGNKKLSLNQNVWRDHATMQQDVLLHFWVIFLYQNQAEIWKKYSVVQQRVLFHCLPLWKTVLFVSSRAFSLFTPVENSEATWKKATKCNKNIFHFNFQNNHGTKLKSHFTLWHSCTLKINGRSKLYIDHEILCSLKPREVEQGICLTVKGVWMGFIKDSLTWLGPMWFPQGFPRLEIKKKSSF